MVLVKFGPVKGAIELAQTNKTAGGKGVRHVATETPLSLWGLEGSFS